MTDLDVDVRAWNVNEAFAVVDGITVRVRRTPHGVRWRCQECGLQYNHPRCPHARAFANTPIPNHENRSTT